MKEASQTQVAELQAARRMTKDCIVFWVSVQGLSTERAQRTRPQVIMSQSSKDACTQHRTTKAQQRQAVAWYDNGLPYSGNLTSKNTWIYGEAGGHDVRNLVARSGTPEEHTWGGPSGENLEFFDGYQAAVHTRMLVEDPPAAARIAPSMLAMGSRFPAVVKSRGGINTFNPNTKVVVNSTRSIDETFSDPQMRSIMHKRFGEVHIDNEEEARAREGELRERFGKTPW